MERESFKNKIMPTETNLDEVRQWGKSMLLVSVTGNSLQLNPEAFNLFEGSSDKDLSLKVISVVGQPKARKTSLMNALLKCLFKNQQVPPNPFPLTSDENEYSDLNGREGILLWKYPQPVSNGDDTASIWLFMDIWMEYPRDQVYKKLVDFCLTNSSTVIFSETCNPNPGIYWRPSESMLPSTLEGSSLQLHFVLQFDEPSIIFSSNKPPDKSGQCQAEFTHKLEVVTSTSRFLEPRCKRVTRTLLPTEEINGFMFEAMVEFLHEDVQSPFENKDLIKISNFSGWIQKSIDAINATEMNVSVVEVETKVSNLCEPHFSTAASGPAQDIANSQTGGGANSDSSDKSQPADEDYEMKDVSSEGNFRTSAEAKSPASKVLAKDVPSQPLTKSKVPQAVEPTEILRDLRELYVSCFQTVFLNIPNNGLYFDDSELRNHHEEIYEKTLQKFRVSGYPVETEAMVQSKLFEWFQEFEDLNNNKEKTYLGQLESEAHAKLHEIIEFIEKQSEEQLNKDPTNFYFRFNSENFDNFISQIKTSLPPKFQQQITNIFVAAKKDLQTTMDTYNFIIRRYVENVKVLLEKKICLEPSQFEQYHTKILGKAKVNYKDSRYKTMNALCENAIECHKKQFQEQNSRAYLHLQEEVESKEAYDYALLKYKDFIENKISSNTLTEQDLQRVHRSAMETITKLFLSALEVPHTQPWHDQQKKLTEDLNTLPYELKQKNQNHLKNVESAKKEGFLSAELRYQEVMDTSLPEFQLAGGLLNDCHNQAQIAAIDRLKEKTSHLHRQISKGWETEFRNNSMADLKRRYENYNRSKKQQPSSFTPPVHPKTDQIPLPPATIRASKALPYGIGLYIDPNQICVGVYVNQEVKFDQNIILCEPPNIAIINGQVSIGKEAHNHNQKSEGLCYHNIFELMNTHNDFKQQVLISGRQTNLGREEILSIFFHRVWMELVKSLNQRVNSCYVAVTGLLSSGAKQILKTSLTIAGFQDNNIISCTTAMAVSYVLKCLKPGTLVGKTKSIIVTYATAKLVEIASVNVGEKQIHVRSLNGAIKHDDSKFDLKRVISVFRNKPQQRFQTGTSSQFNHDEILLCYGEYVDKELDEALSSQLIQLKLPNYLFNWVNDIVRVAAALDAKRNHHPDLSPCNVNFPSYNTISPYCIVGKINQNTIQFLPFNSQVPVHGSCPLASYVQGDIVMEELATDCKSQRLVARYKFQTEARQTSQFVLTWNEEGNLTVATNPEGLIIKTNSKSMVSSEYRRISEILTPVLRIQETLHGIKLPGEQVMQPAVITAKTVESKDHAAESTERDNLVQGVKELVEKVKEELESSKNTSMLVKKNILTKIEKCEELTASNNWEVRNLEMAKTNLEKAAELIG